MKKFFLGIVLTALIVLPCGWFAGRHYTEELFYHEMFYHGLERYKKEADARSMKEALEKQLKVEKKQLERSKSWRKEAEQRILRFN